MYYDYSKPVDQRTESIPAEKFDVSPVPSNITLIMLVGGAIILAIGATVMATSAYGSTCFWLATGETAFATASTILALLGHFSDNKYYQSMMLHRAQSFEDYTALLETDQEVSYSFTIPSYLENRKKEDPASLEKQTDKDKGRSIYIFNGERINPVEKKEQLGEAYRYANQSTVYDMMCILMSRYHNINVNASLMQRRIETKDTASMNTKYTFADGSLEISQLYQISDLHKEGQVKCLKYIKATIQIDFETKDAIVSWTSPQDDLPEL